MRAADGIHRQKDVCQPDQLIKSSTMATDKLPFGTTTIVGGRPMRRAVEVSDLPQGVERVLTLAALNHRFRLELLRDPVAAAASKGIALDPVETALLRTARPEQLTAMAERMVVPKSSDRRSFVKAVSASIVAMVGGKAIMLCSGCTGMDTWRRDAAGGLDGAERDAPVQQWIQLNGYTCYLYLSRQLADQAAYGGEHPVMIALHGEDETCLASIRRWGTAADTNGFAIVAVSWTEVATTAATKSQLARDLGGILQAYRTRFLNPPTRAAVLSSRGASTTIAFQAACLEPNNTVWTGAAFLGGVPDGDWISDPTTAMASLQAKVPDFLYYLRGDADAEYAQAGACITALRSRNVNLYTPTASGLLANAVLDFSEICTYLRI
jgi:hypothetical protein